MDILSIIGLVLAANAVLLGAVLRGAGLMALISMEAFMVVGVGTVAATCIHTPLPVVKHALKIFPWIIKPPPRDGQQIITKIVEWSNTARKQGLLGLEPLIARESDSFVQKSLQLVVDGSEPEAISSAMSVELNMREHADITAAKMFECAGIYSPTLGIIGAVLGLMAVLQNLTDPSKLGAGIASAFTATIYGISLANLFFLPVAGKLKGIIHRQTQVREMIIDGMMSIAQGENPRAIEAKLQGYLH
ncbi:MAG: flagellar motor protein [Steroidobacteraceae bacterium]